MEDDPGAPVSELFKVLQQNEFPFRIYYHEKTFNEPRSYLTSIGRRLRRERWSPARSRELLGAPQRMSSIEIRYHKENVKVPISAEDYLKEFTNLTRLLKSKGLVIIQGSR